MTNIKRVLSLALAAVMLMGMMVIGAGAANIEYSDAESIENAEAVEVLTALDVLGGYPDGSFKPEGTLTRAEAAAVICRIMLGADVAESLSTATAPFADVKATNWAAGYLAYLKNLGVISGIGNNKYNPQGTVTVGEFAKMLLGAAGVEGQYTGSSWLINVSVAAQKAGILTSKDVVTANATRDAVAGYTFNTLNVGEDTTKTSAKYVVEVMSVSGLSYKTPAGGSAYTADDFNKLGGQYYDTYTAAQDAVNAIATNATYGTHYKISVMNLTVTAKEDSLGYTVFGLEKTDSKADAFGRPANTWTYKDGKKTVTIGTYTSEEAALTYTTSVKSSDIYTGLGLSKQIEVANVTVKEDGANGTAHAITKTGADKDQTFGGQGALTEVYYDGEKVTIIVVNTYMDTVSKVTVPSDTNDLKKNEVTLKTSGLEFSTNDFAKNDVVLYTKANNEVQSMALAGTVSGELSKIATSNGTKTYTIGGVAYSVAAKGATNIDANLGKTVNVYVDAYGNIMGDVAATAAATNYILVLANGESTASGSFVDTSNKYVYEVYGILSDGTYGIYKVNSQSVVTANTKSGVYTYETASNGNLELSASAVVGSADTTNGINVGATTVNSKILNSATTFIFFETTSSTDKTISSLTVKTGNTNIGANIAADTAKYIVANSNGVASVVFVSRSFSDGATLASYAFVDESTETSSTESTSTGTVTTFTYTAYTADGTKITLTTKTRITVDGIYRYNTDNTVASEITSDKVTGTVTAINGSVVTIGTTSYNLPEDVAFLGDDTALAVGQTVVAVKNTTNTSTLDAIWVTADQDTVTLTKGTVTDTYTASTSTTELVKGTGVVNTVKIDVTGNFTGKTSITIGNADSAESANVYTLSEAEKVEGTITVTVTFTAPSNNVTYTVTVA